ncbi:branched-chain amino acid aminotransferase [Breoghania sp. L-A4]|uniref:branched-chain amino acid aminotransferase n=1 Tax=Breoghania sp. L-A4 TaxID=2304600 RepID=UPI000E35C26A|nr:branched-chain amino acid aminotransferase [Breoghania sp. L-A4]AXS39904.1 branched-chain amino acid aminotransferase [Breoghania sp. L-A4]
MTDWSQTWTWIDGAWHEGNPPMMGPRTHAAWLGSSVFDGARTFEGVTPDLDLHCERVNVSAVAMGLKPTMSVADMMTLTRDGIGRFAPGTALYIKPMYWAEGEGIGTVAGDPETTRFCLCLYESPIAASGASISVTLSPFRRPSLEYAPVNAKTGSLYPNNARALVEARGRGFDNAVFLDMMGNVAELATANIFMVKDGVIKTPFPNGSFLNGITRQRIIRLLGAVGDEVVECVLGYDDFLEADEIFSTGNYHKVVSVGRIEESEKQPGPVAAKARALYWDFAHA